MGTNSAPAAPDVDRVRHVVCPACESAESVSYRNKEGSWYCRCLNCACRFWAS